MALLSSDDDHVVVDSKAVYQCAAGASPLILVWVYKDKCMMMKVMEKRQVILRSCQLCRKRPLIERMKRSLVRVQMVIMWFRLRSARKARFAWCGLIWLVLSRLRFALLCRRRRYIGLMNNHCGHSRNSSSFW